MANFTYNEGCCSLFRIFRSIICASLWLAKRVIKELQSLYVLPELQQPLRTLTYCGYAPFSAHPRGCVILRQKTISSEVLVSHETLNATVDTQLFL